MSMPKQARLDEMFTKHVKRRHEQWSSPLRSDSVYDTPTSDLPLVSSPVSHDHHSEWPSSQMTDLFPSLIPFRQTCINAANIAIKAENSSFNKEKQVVVLDEDSDASPPLKPLPIAKLSTVLPKITPSLTNQVLNISELISDLNDLSKLPNEISISSVRWHSLQVRNMAIQLRYFEDSDVKSIWVDAVCFYEWSQSASLIDAFIFHITLLRNWTKRIIQMNSSNNSWRDEVMKWCDLIVPFTTETSQVLQLSRPHFENGSWPIQKSYEFSRQITDMIETYWSEKMYGSVLDVLDAALLNSRKPSHALMARVLQTVLDDSISDQQAFQSVSWLYRVLALHPLPDLIWGVQSTFESTSTRQSRTPSALPSDTFWHYWMVLMNDSWTANQFRPSLYISFLVHCFQLDWIIHHACGTLENSMAVLLTKERNMWRQRCNSLLQLYDKAVNAGGCCLSIQNDIVLLLRIMYSVASEGYIEIDHFTDPVHQCLVTWQSDQRLLFFMKLREPSMRVSLIDPFLMTRQVGPPGLSKLGNLYKSLTVSDDSKSVEIWQLLLIYASDALQLSCIKSPNIWFQYHRLNDSADAVMLTSSLSFSHLGASIARHLSSNENNKAFMQLSNSFHDLWQQYASFWQNLDSPESEHELIYLDSSTSPDSTSDTSSVIWYDAPPLPSSQKPFILHLLMSSADKEAVKVIVRCRPFNQKEKDEGHFDIVNIDGTNRTVAITDPSASNSEALKQFTFDAAFDSNSIQQDVFNETARPIVDAVMNGYNGTIFAYGQTGTGKSFTMEGVRNGPPELRGIIPNAIQYVFERIRVAAGTNTQFLVRASYLEIYNEDIYDLLAKSPTKLDIKERPDTGVYVKDLSTFVVNSVDEMDKLMNIGNKNRAVGATLMNSNSSRSHSIFTITVEASETLSDGEAHIRAGKLHLVDLAGSERQGKTGATGERLKEATKINLSLSALGNVISALVDGKSSHIPYRDSKLTRLLQDSLGGNAKTVMIATLSPASYNYEETLSTLRYANRAKNIKNKPKINEDPKDALLREYQEEIKRLRQQLEVDGATENNDENKGTSSQEAKKGSSKNKKEKKKADTESSKTDISTSALTSEQLAEMQASIEKEKKALIESKDIIESERQKILAELEGRAAELEKEQNSREQLAKRLSEMEAKLLVGGVNILDKTAQQAMELERQKAELAERHAKERALQRELEQQQAAQWQIEEEYTNLTEEAAAKTRQLKKMWLALQNTRSELQDIQAEHQRECADLLDTIQELTRELKYKHLLLGAFIPDEAIRLIANHAEYDAAAEKWRIEHIAHAGNNIRGKRSIACYGMTTTTGDRLTSANSRPKTASRSGATAHRRNQQSAGGDRSALGSDTADTTTHPLWDTSYIYLSYQSNSVAGSHETVNSDTRPRTETSPTRKSKSSSETARPSSAVRKVEKTVTTPTARGLVARTKHYA